MIEAITVLLLGAYARGWGIDPAWIVAVVFLVGHLLARFVRLVMRLKQ